MTPYVATAKTVALRGWDCRLFVSDTLWNDANYALNESSAGWREVMLEDTSARAALLERFGCFPEWPGEFVEYPGADDERAAYYATRGY
jgi:hypothetical protein